MDSLRGSVEKNLGVCWVIAGCESALYLEAKKANGIPGMHYKKCGQQIKGGDLSPLFCPGKATFGVLCLIVFILMAISKPMLFSNTIEQSSRHYRSIIEESAQLWMLFQDTDINKNHAVLEISRVNQKYFKMYHTGPWDSETLPSYAHKIELSLQKAKWHLIMVIGFFI